MEHKKLLPCGHDSLNRITHVDSDEFKSKDVWYECMFCPWTSKSDYKPFKSLDTVLKNLIQDWMRIYMENPELPNSLLKKKIDRLVKSYSGELRKYALESFSSLGGQATAKKHGKEHFSKIAKGWPKGKKRKIIE